LEHRGVDGLGHSQSVVPRRSNNIAIHRNPPSRVARRSHADSRHRKQGRRYARGARRLVEIFCITWNRDPAVGRLHEAMATDPEFAQALIGRNERRRKTINVLVERIAGTTAAPRARREAVDMIFALTSFAMFAMLRQDRSVDDVCALVKTACRSALDPPLPDRRRSSRS
jgi:hypothetical protein